MPTPKDMLEQLREGQIALPPLTFRVLPSDLPGAASRRVEALIEVSWRRHKVLFRVECQALSTPKAVEDGLPRLKTSPLPQGVPPLLLVPFLDESHLTTLEQEGISGMDLCGNGVVMVKERWVVYRSGRPNRFPSSAPIKNIYRHNSSMVGRVFLARSCYPTVQAVWKEINRRNPLVAPGEKKPMSLSTVSKVLKTLEADLIVTRKDAIRLRQPEKLLEKLSDHRVAPIIKRRVRLTVPEEVGTITALLHAASQALELPLVATGTSSVGRYAVMQRGDLLSIYCSRLEPLVSRMPGHPSERFPNLEVLETEEETVFFDRREEGGFWWASPVQVYLELMAGDQRDRATAAQVGSYLVNRVEEVDP